MKIITKLFVFSVLPIVIFGFSSCQEEFAIRYIVEGEHRQVDAIVLFINHRDEMATMRVVSLPWIREFTTNSKTLSLSVHFQHPITSEYTARIFVNGIERASQNEIQTSQTGTQILRVSYNIPSRLERLFRAY